MKTFLHKLKQGLLRCSPGTAALLTLLLLGSAIWMFAELADEVLEGETQQIDTRLLLHFRTTQDLSDPIGPPWIEEIARDTTALGGMGVLTFLSLAVFGLFLLQKKARYGGLLVLAVVGGLLLSQAFKAGFDRARPDLVPHGSYVHTASFPSGHSTMSAVVYLTLATMLASVEPRKRLQAYYVFLAILITLGVGISRVYLGVHWPSDVAAGWALGAGWALSCHLAVRLYLHLASGKKTLSPTTNSEP